MLSQWKGWILNVSLVQKIRSSLTLRSAVVITIVAVLLVAIFSVIASNQLRKDVFETRRDQILEDASLRFQSAQAVFDQSTASSPEQIQEAARQVAESTRASAAGAGAVSILILRSEASDSAVRINEIADPSMRGIVTQTFRDAVNDTDEAHWQSVDIGQTAASSNPSEPGILVGTKMTLPSAGIHEFYIVYSLANDQAMVSTVLRVLGLIAVPLVVLIPLLLSWMLHQLLRPVRETSRAAAELAHGDLDARVPVAGTDEMSDLARAFNDMASSLQDQITEYDTLSKLQQRFVSDVSHELRTPLTTIRMAEEMIWMDRRDMAPATKRSAELLHDQVDRFEVMLADLLEISRYDAQSALLEAETTDLRTIVAKVVTSEEELAARLGIPVYVGTPDERCSAEVDVRRIERVLRNLLINALEHADGTRVKIDVAANEHAASVRVRDYGIGMTDEIAARVFDRFYRADPARARTTGGTGLGLAIAKEDVALHSGNLEVYGQPGKGASFLVTLPRKIGLAFSESPLSIWEETQL